MRGKFLSLSTKEHEGVLEQTVGENETRKWKIIIFIHNFSWLEYFEIYLGMRNNMNPIIGITFLNAQDCTN